MKIHSGIDEEPEKKMFNMYDGYHFFGMHMLWWFFWIVFIGVIFGAYEPVRRNRRGIDSISPPRKSEARKGRREVGTAIKRSARHER
jgi:hypothetical protein